MEMEKKEIGKIYINCSNCGKRIEQKGTRTVCIKCRNVMDKIRIAQRTQTEEFKRIQHEKCLEKKAQKPVIPKRDKR